jgi:hypothetical protein
MVNETWLSTDLPLLAAIVEVEREVPPGSMIDARAVLDKAGLTMESDDMTHAVLRLAEGDYVDVVLNKGGGQILGWYIVGAKERARRATGQWPPDDAYLSLIQVVQEQMEGASDEATKGKLRTVLEGLLSAGRDIGVDLTAEYLKRITPM